MYWPTQDEESPSLVNWPTPLKYSPTPLANWPTPVMCCPEVAEAGSCAADAAGVVPPTVLAAVGVPVTPTGRTAVTLVCTHRSWFFLVQKCL